MKINQVKKCFYTIHTLSHLIILFIYLFIYLSTYLYLSIWLCWVLVAAARGVFVAAGGIFSCGMWDLVPSPGIEPGPPALGAGSLSHWTTREVPCHTVIQYFTFLF